MACVSSIFDTYRFGVDSRNDGEEAVEVLVEQHCKACLTGAIEDFLPEHSATVQTYRLLRLSTLS